MIHAFEQTKAEAARAEAEVLYCEAQICLQGDVHRVTALGPDKLRPSAGAQSRHKQVVMSKDIRS